MPEAKDVQSIYRALRERVALMDYGPGSLLSENRLAKEFAVSRTPIRQALQRLEFDGLVTVERGVGTVISPIDMVYLKQVYDLRLKLIDVIAELRANWVSPDEVAALRDLDREVLAMSEGGSPRGLAKAYLRFNEAVTRAIGNQPLREIADRLFYLTARVWLQVLPELDWREEVEFVSDEITRAADALERGDMPALAATRRQHMIGCIRRINAYLGDFDLEGPTSAHPAPSPNGARGGNR